MGSSEIEFSIDLGTGTQDRLTLTGGPGSDSIVFGALGANTNGDDDVDLTLTGVELATVNASEGADTVSGAGDGAPGPRRRSFSPSAGIPETTRSRAGPEMTPSREGPEATSSRAGRATTRSRAAKATTLSPAVLAATR
jgi:hypothetical protein